MSRPHLPALSAIVLLLLGCGPPPPPPAVTGGDDVPMQAGSSYKLAFDTSSPGVLPQEGGLVLANGQWEIVADEQAASAPNVLTQTTQLIRDEIAVAIVRNSSTADMTMRGKCRIDGGDVDQVCGFIFHVTDSRNYMLLRASVLEHKVDLLRVTDSQQHEVASAQADVVVGQWYAFRLMTRGARATVDWNDTVVVEGEDATIASGKFGFWIHADSAAMYDDFEVLAE